MDIYDFSFSIVILAAQHNPTILNPDFLKRTGIVDEKWILDEKSPTLTTPAHSEFRFTTGIAFSLDPFRLIIRDLLPDGDIFPVPIIAKKYITTVPHVKYNKIGINFESAIIFDSLESAKSFQKSKYLSDGPWNVDNNLLEFTTKFVFKIDNGQCNVSLSSAKKIQLRMMPDAIKHGILIRCNFDRSFQEEKHEDILNKIIDTIENWEEDKKFFNDIVSKLL